MNLAASIFENLTRRYIVARDVMYYGYYLNVKLGRRDDELGCHRLHRDLLMRAGQVREPVGHQAVLTPQNH